MATIVTTFTTINGMLVHEDRGGAETEYVSDPLGSLVQTRNSSGTKTYEAEYWPYGELQTSTGTNPSSWGYVGLLGYLTESATMIYVRARYLLTKYARWLTKDPLWPMEAPFVYVQSNPATTTDPQGLTPAVAPWIIIVIGIVLACLVAALFGWLAGKDFKDICEQCLDVLIGGLVALTIIAIFAVGGWAAVLAWLISIGIAADVAAGLIGIIAGGFSANFLHPICSPNGGGSASGPCGDYDRDNDAGRNVRRGNKNFAG